MLPGTKSFRDVLAEPPGALLSWVQQHLAAIDGSQDWQDLAYGIKLSTDVDSLTDGEFAALATAAVLIYDRLAESCKKRSERSRFRDIAMALRAGMIDQFGPQTGHAARDPAILEDWFFRGLEMPFEQAFLMGEMSPTDLSTDDFLRLHYLKDCVRLMKSIRSQEVFRRTDELEKWYTLPGTSPSVFEISGDVIKKKS
jgi:hypothetical protein